MFKMTKLLAFRYLVSRTPTLVISNSQTPFSLPSRCLSTTSRLYKKDKGDEGDDYKEYGRIPQPQDDPIGRTWRIVKHDIKSVFSRQPPIVNFRSHVDVLIIGGGILGSCIAHSILDRIPRGALSCMVVEKDPTYKSSATTMSVGGLRQQFSIRDNVEMARYGADYLRNAHKILKCGDDPPPDIKYHPYGYLQLANGEQAETLQETWLQQKELGCHVELLTQEKIKDRFPWINTQGVECGLYGYEGEGWFDAWAFHFALKKRAHYLGAEYVHAEAVGFEFEESETIMVAGREPGDHHELVKRLIVKTPHGELRTVTFALCIIAAGHESGKVAEMARIGRRKEHLSVQLPIEPRKRYVYCIHAPNGPGIDCPLVVNTDGSYFRREGYAGHFVAGKSPPLGEEPEIGNLDVNYEYFDKEVWPSIAHRVPGFKKIKLNSAWAGYYDYNVFDQSVVVGTHPFYPSLFFACGLSGYGIQQAPAVARATQEIVLDGFFKTLDLSKFSFERFFIGKKFQEKHII